jgi:simple sugar transport system ATP-binding protein
MGERLPDETNERELGLLMAGITNGKTGEAA